MKYRRLTVSDELFLGMFAAGAGRRPYEVIKDAIPPDAEIVSVRHGLMKIIDIVLCSESFAEVEPGAEIPTIIPLMRTT